MALRTLVTVKNQQTGREEEIVNPLKPFINTTWLFCTPANPNADPAVTLNAAGAPGSTFAGVMQAFQDAHVSLSRFCDNDIATANYTILLRDLAYRRDLMNAPIHIQTICGDAQQPFVLPETIFLPATNGLQATFANLAAAPFTTRFCGVGWKIHYLDAEKVGVTQFKIERPTNVMFLTTRINPLVIPGLTTIEAPIDVPDYGEFEVCKITHYEIAGNPFLFGIRDGASGRLWSNGMVHSDVGSGNGNFPFKLPEPTIQGRKNVIPMQITNPNVGSITLYLTLTGRMLRYERTL